MGKPSRNNPARRLGLPMFVAALVLVVCGRAVSAQSAPGSVVLGLPSALVYDAQGDLYFAERTNHMVRELGTDGTVTVVAGTGAQGFSGDGGPAASAQLDSPQGLALDASGNLYIADTHNHRVRRVTAGTGVIATIGGTGTGGFAGDNGLATSAELDSPTALAVDGSGNVFVADLRNQRVRRIAAATGIITTVAGSGTQGFSGDNGPATSAAIDSPSGLAVDSSGNLYLADMRNDRIRRVAAATGIITTVAGSSGAPGLPAFSGDSGLATAATLALPRGLTIDTSGNIYVADSANQRVRRIGPDGTITTVAGQGSEAFAGDGGAAVSASLDSPRAVALSPADLLTLTDTANARIRQLDGATTSADIHTIVGPGAGTTLATGALTLSGAAASVYGSGSLTAALADPSATGAVSFVQEASGGAQVNLGSVAVAAGSATLNTAALSAGTYSIVAIYSGDSAHAAAQSQPFTRTVTPLAITAAAQPAGMVFGQAVPVLAGTLNGVLAQDSGAVSATFSTAAGSLSPPGTYAIGAALGGTAAANYSLSSTSGSLTVSQAPVSVTLVVSSSSVLTGSGLTVTVEVLSTTTGVPTGTVSVLDSGTSLGQLALANGLATYTSSALAAGTHSFSATYSGDTDFLPGTAQPVAVSVVTVPDFTLASSDSGTQSIPSGSPATYAFAVTSSAAFASPIALTVTGIPVGASASMNPAYIPPGGAVTAFTLTVETTKTLSANQPPGGRGLRGGTLAAIFLTPLLFAGGANRTRRRFPRVFFIVRVIFAVLAGITSATLCSGCASRVNTASEAEAGQSYTLTITGTATSAAGTVLQHSVDVTLKVL